MNAKVYTVSIGAVKRNIVIFNICFGCSKESSH